MLYITGDGQSISMKKWVIVRKFVNHSEFTLRLILCLDMQVNCAIMNIFAIKALSELNLSYNNSINKSRS